MSLWRCECGYIIPCSLGAPVCRACGGINVQRVEMGEVTPLPSDHISGTELRGDLRRALEERDAARRAHLATQAAWEALQKQNADMEAKCGAEEDDADGLVVQIAQLHEIRTELLAELECERLDSHGLMERCRALDTQLDVRIRDEAAVAAVKDALIDALRELSDTTREIGHARVENIRLREQIADAAVWRRLAFEKVRTRRAVVERVAAGEPVEAVAADYDVPVEWVTTISEPGFDFSADPEAEIEALKADLAQRNDLCQDLADRCKGYRQRWAELREWMQPCIEDEGAVRTAMSLVCEHMDELAGVSERSPHGTTVSGRPSDVLKAQTSASPAPTDEVNR